MQAEENKIKTYLEQTARAVRDVPRQPLHDILIMLQTARHAERRLFTLGNGGSGSTAGLLASELLYAGEPPLRTMCLSESAGGLLSGVARAGYEQVFALPLRRLGQAGDVLLALSGSGNSPNALAAVQAARGLGMHTAALAGFAGGKLNGQADVCLVAPSQNMMQIEDVFAVIGSALAAALSQPQANPDAVMDTYLNASAKMIAALPDVELQQAATLLRQAQQERRRVFCLADGAGIFFATHMVNDLIKYTLRPDLPRMQAICLADNESAMTAFANDVGSHAVFAEPLRSLAQPGDLALFYVLDGTDAGLTGAAQAVGELGLSSIVLAGGQPGEPGKTANVLVQAPAAGSRWLGLDAFAVFGHALAVGMMQSGGFIG